MFPEGPGTITKGETWPDKSKLRLLADSRDDALMLAAEALIDNALAGKFEEPPVINAFQWHAPRTVLQ